MQKITTYANEDHVSYYINDVLIKNNLITTFNAPARIEFDKHGDSYVSITHRGEIGDNVVYATDSSGNFLIGGDNIVLTI